jgi:PAS domain S-box-containing protein
VDLNVTIFPIRGRGGAVTHAAIQHLDVTERKRAEEALRESEARYRLVSENGTDVIWLYDLTERRFVYVSPSVERLRGYSVEEVSRQSFEQALTPESYRMVLELLPARLAALAAGDEAARIQTHEVEQPRKDGSVVPTEVVTTLITDAAGQVTHLQGVTRDLSERRRAEAERAKLEAQLRESQKLESIGRLAGGIAHDFNNLLSVILGTAGLLADELREPDPLRADLEEIRHAAERAATLTRQQLAFSRKQLLLPEVLRVNEVVEGIESMLRRMLGEDIELATDLAADLGRVLADRGQLEQVLMNLAVNARDAMPSGGRLTIETANVELDADYAAQHVAARPGSYVALAVSDTGCGIDAETKAQIFEPFFTTKETGKGTGLGLSTVYGIVKQSGGYIWVYSEPGTGTTFKVYLPRVETPAAEPRRGSLRRSPPGARRCSWSRTRTRCGGSPSESSAARGTRSWPRRAAARRCSCVSSTRARSISCSPTW